MELISEFYGESKISRVQNLFENSHGVSESNKQKTLLRCLVEFAVEEYEMMFCMALFFLLARKLCYNKYLRRKFRKRKILFPLFSYYLQFNLYLPAIENIKEEYNRHQSGALKRKIFKETVKY